MEAPELPMKNVKVKRKDSTMRFERNSQNWNTIEQGEKDCFLLTNGLGGYSSLSVIGSLARGDQALLMSAQKAPNVRRHLISNLLETFSIDGTDYVLTSQRMMNQPDLEGFRYLESFSYDKIPTWTYRIGDVVISKRMVMVHGENTVALQYSIHSEQKHQCRLTLTPMLRFSPKKEEFCEEQQITVNIEQDNLYQISGNEDILYVATNAQMREEPCHLFGPMYFSQDERDGREKQGMTVCNHSYISEIETGETSNDINVIFSTKPYTYHEGLFDELLHNRQAYEEALLKKAHLTSEIGRQLVLSADAYVVDRESTQGKSIIAGYPFFEDWGRDTMIALAGTTMVTGRLEECKSILQTFAKYEHHGLLPNLFPEGDVEPMYNSVDAPLLFINAVYEYIQTSKDNAFLPEVWDVLKRIMTAYEKGTDYHIGMDTDCLIQAGAELEQLTWMDVRVGDYLPTPRHGKPVEINAYWYNDLKIMEQFALLQQDNKLAQHYAELADKVKEAFLLKFWNDKENCLKDVLSGNEEENQVRCNQVWALSMPYTMLPKEKELCVLHKIKEELYTTAGLRTLSPKDSAFHDIYIGSMQERDRAYHQGTVWAFPLGAYYRAWIKYLKQDASDMTSTYKTELSEGIEEIRYWLEEGCLGQLAEIYDGAKPTVSRGCFAQAWSVGELLRAVYEWEQL